VGPAREETKRREYGGFGDMVAHARRAAETEVSWTFPREATRHEKLTRCHRSSLSQQIGALGDAGGVNSINNFARSWQRAAGFFEITPVRPSFRVETDDDSEPSDFPRTGLGSPAPDHRSALRKALQTEDRRPSDNAVVDEEQGPTEETQLLPNTVLRARGESIFNIEPSLSSPFGGSYGTGYGSLSARVNESSMRHAGRLFTDQQLKGVTEPEQEREPLLVKQIEEDGHIINVVVGQSTLPQTIFNSVNVLVGVGLLTLPLAFKYSGWIIGMIFLAWSAIVTGYTAKLLAKCLDVDSSLITFADLAFVSFGNKARIAVSLLFSLELLAACVALVVLFADSMDALVPGWDTLTWKIVCGIILIPLSFLPLRFLSFTSILGVMSCFGSKHTSLFSLCSASLILFSHRCSLDRWSRQARHPRLHPPTCNSIPPPRQPLDHSPLLRPPHVPLGWPLCLSQHLP
jgi:solute carrier family 32 (vesicular inhibitory amino acid transporter)